MRLQRPSAHGVLKTLKSVKQLVQKGSREFRKALRENDEHIKNAPDYGSQQGSYLGTDVHEQMRRISQEILRDLFDQDTIERDNSKEAEVVPVQSSTMAGMGRSTMVTSQGRLEGFGSEPVDKSSMMDKARDMLESVVNLPDPKKQIMELCLKEDVGNYEAVHLPGLPPVEGRRLVGGVMHFCLLLVRMRTEIFYNVAVQWPHLGKWLVQDFVRSSSIETLGYWSL